MEFIVRGAEATRHHLGATLRHATTASEGDVRRLQTSTAILAEIWAKLHNFVKPVADADTLNVPIGLALLLNRAVSGLPDLKQAKIAVELTSPLNYFQRRHDPLRGLAALLQLRLGASTQLNFPNDLGIIGIPYSQGGLLFLNCLFYHELGHYVVEQRNLTDTLRNEADTRIAEVLPKLTDDRRRKLAKVIRSWLEEVFCDLFAVRLLGPAYTFVFAELFDLLGDFREQRAALYHGTHPAGTVRLHEQLEILREAPCNWDPVLSELQPDLYSQITTLAAKHEEIPPSCEDVPVEMVRAFRSALPKVRELAKSAANGQSKSPETFLRVREEIVDCLAHGIVPSTVYKGTNAEEWCVMLINAAYFLQLGDLENLFSIIAKPDKNDVQLHARIRQRIEQWSLKAIEDILRSL